VIALGNNKRDEIQRIGIDIGGANVKIVDHNGVHIHYCPLWKGGPLKELLSTYNKESGSAAVVMSGELADCFSGKAEGIRFIVGTVKTAFPDAIFYGTDAKFHDDAVPELAASNWLVSADYLRELYPGAVFVDIGSTTTDIIPIGKFEQLKGLTDLHRLQKGYLLYHGMLRTSIPCLVRAVTLDGVPTSVSSEYFACSADAHLVLGHIQERDYISDPPDGGDRTVRGSLRRLARVVCSDLEEIGESGAREIAETFWREQKNLIISGIDTVCQIAGTDEVIFAGIGSGLIAKKYGGTNLSGALGPVVDALPAFAAREVAIRDSGS
jgi:(4-(4-[2-(gamma-L-glutamylamino)ethyl]phenoxymethyl)furan-2-yl)methanamine synthase